jgi:hypothetical protein
MASIQQLLRELKRHRFVAGRRFGAGLQHGNRIAGSPELLERPGLADCGTRCVVRQRGQRDVKGLRFFRLSKGRVRLGEQELCRGISIRQPRKLGRTFLVAARRDQGLAK